MKYTTTSTPNEISLFDLWKVLIKRKKTILLVIIVSVIVGFAIAMRKHKSYQYTTTIEIGTTLVRGDVRLIDDPETLLAKIQESYIPLTLHEYRSSHPNEHSTYTLTARIPKKSQIIVLEGVGSNEQAVQYKHLENSVVEQIIKDHARLILVIRKDFQLQIEKISNEIDSLKDQAKLLEAKSKRLQKNEKLLAKQIDTIRLLLNAGAKNREKASREVKEETRAMTLLMIDNEIQQNRQRLDDLQEKLTVTVANDKDQVDKTLADTRRKIVEKASELSKTQLQLENMKETRAIVPPMQSLEPVGTSRKTIVFLAMMLGFFVALLTAFIHEFIANARQELAKESE